MRKVIAAINMTLDVLCGHTSKIPDEEIHQHYTELLFVFSRMLENTEWESAKLSSQPIEEDVSKLKHSGNDVGKDIFVGSRNLIIQLMKLDLIEEFQLCVHPVIAGIGLQLFENMNDRKVLKLL